MQPNGTVREYEELELKDLNRPARRAFVAEKRRGATDEEAMDAANAAHIGKGKR